MITQSITLSDDDYLILEHIYQELKKVNVNLKLLIKKSKPFL